MSVPDQHLPQQDESGGLETSESESEAAPQSSSSTHGYSTHHVTTATKRWSRKRWLALAVIAVMLFVGLASVVILVVTFSPLKDAAVNATESPLVSAQKKCAPGSPYAKVGDDGSSLDVSGEGVEDFGLPLSQIECILAELRTPDSVLAEMYSIRALDGRQTAQWESIHASWTYHPDHGLHIILTKI
jgi:hypothetical protein